MSEPVKSVPLLDLKAQYAAIKDEIGEAINRVLESQYFILGPEVKALEDEIAEYCHCRYAVGVSSGTDALLLSLRALGIGPGDAVILPSFTFFATAGVIHNVGATPVFCDIDPKTYNLDPNHLRRILSTNSTNLAFRAVIPVHYAGHPVDLGPLEGLADRHNLLVIEDAAHAVPAKYKNRKIGSGGNPAAFSFYVTKNLTTIEGGMLTGTPEWINDVRTLSLHGMSRGAWNRYGSSGKWFYDVIHPGFKYNMTDLQASLGLCQLRKLESLQQRWHEAIEQGHEGRVVPTIKVDTPPRRAPLHFMKTMKYLLLELFYAFLTSFFYISEGIAQLEPELESFVEFLLLVAVIAVVAFLYTLPKLIRAIVILIRHLPVDGTLREMGLSMRDALCATGVIDNHPHRLPVLTTKYSDGSVTLSLGNGSFYEQSLFVDAMDEVLGPIENPRYLLTRQKRRWFWQHRDYHAVPAILGVKKVYAETLYQAWLRRVGESELIYARGREGRKLLLQARARAFSTAMAEKVERLDRWQ